jgi:hypothetical protein
MLAVVAVLDHVRMWSLWVLTVSTLMDYAWEDVEARYFPRLCLRVGFAGVGKTLTKNAHMLSVSVSFVYNAWVSGVDMGMMHCGLCCVRQRSHRLVESVSVRD